MAIYSNSYIDGWNDVMDHDPIEKLALLLAFLAEVLNESFFISGLGIPIDFSLSD
jgi:hypothetical protein